MNAPWSWGRLSKRVSRSKKKKFNNSTQTVRIKELRNLGWYYKIPQFKISKLICLKKMSCFSRKYTQSLKDFYGRNIDSFFFGILSTTTFFSFQQVSIQYFWIFIFSKENLCPTLKYFYTNKKKLYTWCKIRHPVDCWTKSILTKNYTNFSYNKHT